MTAISYDVVGIGNAIVDIIGRCDDAYLASHALKKGSMQLLFDLPAVDALYKGMGPAIEISGGSAANTIVGVASLGGKAAYIGKVADDDFGRIFAHAVGVADVEVEAEGRMIHPLGKLQVLPERLDEKARFRLHEQRHAHLGRHIEHRHDLVVEDVGRLLTGVPAGVVLVTLRAVQQREASRARRLRMRLVEAARARACRDLIGRTED